MKKIAGKIAMLLILVMLGSMFISCFTAWAIEVTDKIENAGLQVIVGITLITFCFVLDLLTWPFQLLAVSKRSVQTADNSALLTEEELAFLTDKTASLAEEDGEFLIALIASIPEGERAAALEQINSVPEDYFASTVTAMRALYVLPQADRVFLVETMRSLPESEQAFFTETSNSLTDEEIAALAQDLISIPAAEMKRQVNILRETPPSEWGYREYAEARFVR